EHPARPSRERDRGSAGGQKLPRRVCAIPPPPDRAIFGRILSWPDTSRRRPLPLRSEQPETARWWRESVAQKCAVDPSQKRTILAAVPEWLAWRVEALNGWRVEG